MTRGAGFRTGSVATWSDVRRGYLQPHKPSGRLSASLFRSVAFPLTGSTGARTPTRIMSLVALTDQDFIGIEMSGCRPGVADAVIAAAAACRSAVLPVTLVLVFHSGPILGSARCQRNPSNRTRRGRARQRTGNTPRQRDLRRPPAVPRVPIPPEVLVEQFRAKAPVPVPVLGRRDLLARGRPSQRRRQPKAPTTPAGADKRGMNSSAPPAVGGGCVE